MSDSNLSTLAYVAEATWGTTPATPSLKKIRLTGESLSHEKSTVESEEVRDDRQVADLVEVGSQASGAVNFELSYEAFQPFLEAAMFNDIILISEAGTWDITTGVAATQTLTFTDVAVADETVTIGTKVYTWKATPTAANHVKVGASAAACVTNLVAAINETAGSEGTLYGTGTVAHASVTAADGTGDTVDITARSEGTTANAIATTETMTNASWGAATLAGGVEPLITGSATDFDNIPIGATIKVAGSATAGNNGLKLVTAKAGDGSTITLARGSMAGDTSSESLTLTGQHLPNSTTRKQFTIERNILNSGANNFFQVYRGMMVDGLNLNFESKQIVTGTLNLLGKLGVDGENTSIDADGAYTAADSGDVVNATSHVGSVLIDGEVTTERFKTIAINVANNLRGKDAIGESGNFDVGVGSFGVTGSLNAYFQDNRFHKKFIDHDDLSLSFRVTDPAGNTIVITLGRLKLSSGSPPIEGKDTDIMIASEFTAILNTTYGFTMCFDFHDA
jgi:hypothetical protein